MGHEGSLALVLLVLTAAAVSDITSKGPVGKKKRDACSVYVIERVHFEEVCKLCPFRPRRNRLCFMVSLCSFGRSQERGDR